MMKKTNFNNPNLNTNVTLNREESRALMKKHGIKKRRCFFKRLLVTSLASLMLLQTVGGSIPVMAADETSICETQEEDQGYVDDTTKGLIKFGIGKIPYVGDLVNVFTDGLVDQFVDTIFGNTGDDQIAELQNQLSNIALDIDAQSKKQLETLYEMSFDSLNKDFTAVKYKTMQCLKNIKKFTSSTTMSEPEKALEIAMIFDLNSSNLSDFTNVVRTAAAYVSGTNVTTGKPESLLTRAFKCSCSKYDMAGNAALKASGYVNQLSTILESAYKVEATVMDSKLFLVDYAKKHPDEYKALKQKFVDEPQRRSLLAQAELEGPVYTWETAAEDVAEMTNLIFNKDDSRSVINRYNKMVKNYWFCFIKDVDIQKNYAMVTYKPMCNYLAPYTLSTLGASREAFKRLYDEKLFYSPAYMEKIDNYGHTCFENIASAIKDTELTSEESKTLMKNLMDNAAKITDDGSEKNAYKVLLDYGFHIDDAIKAMAYQFEDNTVDGLTADQIVEKFKPILFWDARCDAIVPVGLHTYLVGYDFEANNVQDNTHALPIKFKEGIPHPGSLEACEFDPTQHVLLTFIKESQMPADPWEGYNGEPFQAIQASMDANLDAALYFTYVDVPAETDNDPENNDIKDEDTTITLTVDPEGQITGEAEGDAWTLEDGVLTLKADHKFRFEGDLKDLTIINYGEITGGNFINVNMELENGASIAGGTFENGKITVHEGAVIDPNVILTDTEVVDAEENTEEENNGEEVEKDNPDTDITQIVDQNK